MRHANIFLALGGDTGNTVAKLGVSVAEIAVLEAIHGQGSVTDIEPLPGHKLDAEGQRVGNRAELQRLRGLYGAAKDTENNSIVGILFPGAGARVMEEFDELEIDRSFYKATGRVEAAAPTAVKANPLDHDGDGKSGGAAAPVPQPEGLAALTVPQLKDLAEKRGVGLGDAKLKADIIAALEAVDADAETDAVVDDEIETEPGEGDMTDTTKGTSLFK